MIWAYVEFLLRSPYTIYLIDEQFSQKKRPQHKYQSNQSSVTMMWGTDRLGWLKVKDDICRGCNPGSYFGMALFCTYPLLCFKMVVWCSGLSGSGRQNKVLRQHCEDDTTHSPLSDIIFVNIVVVVVRSCLSLVWCCGNIIMRMNEPLLRK